VVDGIDAEGLVMMVVDGDVVDDECCSTMTGILRQTC
jgi:hypothetical protein